MFVVGYTGVGVGKFDKMDDGLVDNKKNRIIVVCSFMIRTGINVDNFDKVNCPLLQLNFRRSGQSWCVCWTTQRHGCR